MRSSTFFWILSIDIFIVLEYTLIYSQIRKGTRMDLKIMVEE